MRQLELPLFHRSMDERTLSSLACMQLSLLIRNGKHVEQSKAERKRQNKLHPKWHGNDHGLAVLAEEFGEVAKAHYELNEARRDETIQALPEMDWQRLHSARMDDLRDELIQVAAVCVRWLENMP